MKPQRSAFAVLARSLEIHEPLIAFDCLWSPRTRIGSVPNFWIQTFDSFDYLSEASDFIPQFLKNLKISNLLIFGNLENDLETFSSNVCKLRLMHKSAFGSLVRKLGFKNQNFQIFLNQFLSCKDDELFATVYTVLEKDKCFRSFTM